MAGERVYPQERRSRSPTTEFGRLLITLRGIGVIIARIQSQPNIQNVCVCVWGGGLGSIFPDHRLGALGNRFRYPKLESQKDVGDILRNGGRMGPPIKSGGGRFPPLLNSATSLITLNVIGGILSRNRSRSMIQKAWGICQFFVIVGWGWSCGIGLNIPNWNRRGA